MSGYRERRQTVGGLDIGPLSAYRIDFLQGVGNVTAGGEGGATGARALAEVFLACACSPDELAAVRVEDPARWAGAVDEFFRNVEDEAQREFAGWLKDQYGAEND